MNKKPKADVAVKRSSAGLGLFATRDFKRGERIIEYIGKRVRNNPDGPINLYVFNVNEKIDIDGSPRWNTARYANHSCAPNAEAVNDNDRIFIEAKKAIPKGEEITYDYGKEYFEDILIKDKGGCRCNKCLKK